MKILLAIDGSACSDAAVREVAGHPWPEGSEVRIVTVDAPLGDAFTGLAPSTFDQLVLQQRQEALTRLTRADELLHAIAPALPSTAALLEGAPKDQIIEEARRWPADVIVVGSQGRGAIRSFFLGSVSLAVVLGAPCSVLVVRPPAGA